MTYIDRRKALMRNWLHFGHCAEMASHSRTPFCADLTWPHLTVKRDAQLNTCVAYITRSCRIFRTHAIIVCNNSLFMTPWDSFLSSVRDLKFKQLKVRSVKLVLVIGPCTLQIYLQIFCSYLQYTVLSILLVVFLRLDLSGILINLYFVERVLPQYV